MTFRDNKKNEPKDEVDEIVDTIIKLPIKNLEARIKNIKADIKERQTIFDLALSILTKREIEIKAHLWTMRYCLGDELKRKFSLENELIKTRSARMNSTISHFHDSQRLKEKLQEAKEKLAIESEKRKLVG